MNKKVLILISLVIFFISIAGVSASDDLNETLEMTDDAEFGADDGTFTALQNKINSAPEGSIVNLYNDYAYNSDFEEEYIQIEKSLTINGHGHTIDGLEKSGIFEIYTSVTLNDINFVNGRGDGTAGAIQCWKKESEILFLNNCKFINNIDKEDIGGAVTGLGISISSCTFINNGRLDLWYSHIENSEFINNHRAIRTSESAVINNCNFINNTDGAIDAGTNTVINNCNFIGNIGDSTAGVKGSSDTEINNCKFINNTAEDDIGGALKNILNVKNSEFVDNYAKYGGMAICGASNIINCTFKSNKNYDDFISGGTEMYLKDNVMISNNNYDILIGGDEDSPVIKTDLYLTFENKTVKPNSTFNLLHFEDDNGNSIILDFDHKIDVKLTNKATKATKNVEFEYYGYVDYSYESYDDEGVYDVTGSVDSKLIKDYKTKNGILIIDGDTNYTLTAHDLTKYYGSSEKFTVTLVNGNGRLIAGAPIQIIINGKPYERITDANGVASIAINLNAGNYSVTCKYDNAVCNASVVVLTTVFGDDLTKYYKNASQYYVTCLDSNGNKIANGNVEFNINGLFYTRTITNGVARMNINLNPGEYTITARNLVNNEFHSNTIRVLTTIVENNDLTKYYKNASQYSIRLLDSQGNPVKKGESVIFNINGVFYTRTSDESGYVKMNINLNPGDYIITADYNGLMLSNKITVLNILEGKDLNMLYRDGSKYEIKLLDGQGNPYPGQNITFNINGVFYNRTTDSEGIARLNINLQPGYYIITSIYNGLFLAHSIQIDNSMNYYECGNGHKLNIVKNAAVTSKDSNSYDIKYKDGDASFTFYEYGDNFDMADYLVRTYDFNNYVALEDYGKWTAIGLTMFDPLKYELLYYDRYLYTITADDLNIAKRVADSFK